MTENIGLIIDLEAKVNKLERGFQRANRIQRRNAERMQRRADQSADRLSSTYGRAGRNIEATFKRLGPALLAGLGVGAVKGAVDGLARVTRQVAEIGDQADIAGVSVERFQQLRFVADQNRIGVDALTDGLKELSLRADEFVTTGAGPAAEAFNRIGLDATTLKEKLKDPSELFLEIVGRLEELDSAAQIRVADEVFGGTGGERFVQLLGQGEAALRRTMRQASETGQVLDADVIAKAQELDAKFTALRTKTANLFKSMAVGAAEFGAQIVNVTSQTTELKDVLRDLGQAGALLGDGVTQGLQETDSAVDEHKAAIAEILAEYEGIVFEATQMGAALQRASRDAERMGETQLAERLREIAIEMQGLQEKLDSGDASAEELEGQLTTLANEASTAVSELVKIDAVAFDGVLVGLGRLITGIATATARARELRASLPGASEDGTTDTPISLGPPRRGGPRGQRVDVQSPTSDTPRPRPAPSNVDFGVPENASGGGGGSRAPRQSDFEREVQAIAEETRALQLEATALAQVTGARINQADAIDLARTKAELLNAALQSGQADTPELRAKIDELATSYVDAAGAAELAADRITDVQDASRRGAQSVASTFEAMATGAITAKEAVGQLILEVLKLSLQRRILDAANGATGGPLGSLLGVLGNGFAGGGYTGDGGRFEPAGVIHRGEYVMSKAATENIGVGNLERLHRAAKSGFAAGGFANRNVIPAMGKSATPTGMNVSIHAPVTVQGSSGTPEQNADLARQMAKQMEGTMRTTVISELQRQLRPGNMLNTGRT